MKTKRLSFLILSLFLFSCGDSEYSDIPYSLVNLTLHLSDTDKELNTMTAHKIYTKNDINTSLKEAVGFGGVVVYHSSYSSGTYKAYDIACPYELKQDVVINIEPYSSTGTCPICGSAYDLESGAPISGPSSENPKGKRLRIYSTMVSGDKIYVGN
ncbi:hypothetical protein [Massilibacteroides sp.]|uniref:Rieske (2Fe-2S) protein n=1 Tax=Massilibacteroides sp. TaxID=2034766 RepID=UPI0026045D0D|nr:hypothetical protein [Massilibacteroides sp.]MDD4514858.1 hypothetical protein [Massilibacteroides sp.]